MRGYNLKLATAVLDASNPKHVKYPSNQALTAITVRELSRKEKLEFNKLQKRLRREVGNAIIADTEISAGMHGNPYSKILNLM